MPTSGLDYDKHGRPARVKLRKEQDNRSVTSSGTSRRHRDSSVSSNRTILPPEGPAQRPASTSSNTNLDHLPSLPESESGSPSSASSSMYRTSSNISTITSMTSPTVPRTPAFLQPYLESEPDPPDILGDSQATPKAEKPKDQCEAKPEPPKTTRSKVDPSKVQTSTSDTGVPIPAKKSSSEITKTVSAQTSPHGPPSTLNQDIEYQDLHQPAPKHPINSSLAIVPDPSHPAPMYPYNNVLPGQHQFYSPQAAYLSLHHQADPSVVPQVFAPQGALYYPDYGPLSPAPEPPNQLRYPPGAENKLRMENPMVLLDRVHSAMPAIHALLDSYHDMYGVLESREAQLRNMETQRAAEKQQQESRLARLEKETESLLTTHSTEISRLRLDISNVDKKCKDLQDKLTAEEKANDRLEATNESLRVGRKAALQKHEEEKAAMAQKYSLDTDRLAADHRAKQRASHDEFQAQIRKAEATLSQREAHLNRSHEEETHRLETSWAKQRREIEDRYAKLLEDAERQLEAKQKVVDEERQTYLQAREGWERERETINRRWEEERGINRKASEEQYKALIAKHEREKNDTLRQIAYIQQRTDKEDQLLTLQRELEMLRSGWEADKFKFQRTTAEFKSTAQTLNEQNNKLQRLTEAFGDAVESKSK